MEAARVAALRGHEVTLWEKGGALGGNGSGATSKTLSRSEFEALSPAKRMEFSKTAGSCVVD